MATRTLVLVAALAAWLAGCASGYGQFYTAVPGATPEAIAANRSGPPPVQPRLEVSDASGDAVVEAYEREGFALIGYSSFSSGYNESEAEALRQGQRVSADLVVVSSPQYTGSVTTTIPITIPTTSTSHTTGTATVFGSGGSATAYGNATTTTYGTSTSYVPYTVDRYDYLGLYFVKQKFAFGVLIRDIDDAERRRLQTNRGVYVTSVVNGTPAYRNDVLSGDIVLAVNGVPVGGVQGFTDSMRANLGGTVNVTIARDGEVLTKAVALD